MGTYAEKCFFRCKKSALIQLKASLGKILKSRPSPRSLLAIPIFTSGLLDHMDEFHILHLDRHARYAKKGRLSFRSATFLTFLSFWHFQLHDIVWCFTSQYEEHDGIRVCCILN